MNLKEEELKINEKFANEFERKKRKELLKEAELEKSNSG